MSNFIQTTLLRAASSDDLATSIQSQYRNMPAVPKLGHDSQPVGQYALIYGPANAEQRDIQSFAGLSNDLVIAGASIDLACGRDDGPMRSQWGALVVQSPYISPVASWANLGAEPTDETNSDELSRFLAQFGEVGQDYFASPTASNIKPSHDIKGAHQVHYRRPAYMLLMLPGTGFHSKIDWPESNVDYQIVQALAERANPDLTIFGFSAAGRMSTKDSERVRPWMFARAHNGDIQHVQSGAVAILVPSDLTFGCGSAHGFEVAQDDHCQMHKRQHGKARAIFPGKFDHRPRYHTVEFGGEDAQRANLDLLPCHTEIIKGKGPLIDAKTVWRTLGFYEGTEFIPNPAYQSKRASEKTMSFLLPMTDGAQLFRATATRDSMLKAVPEAMDRAKRSGAVQRPALTLVANCRGRNWCLRKSPQDDTCVIAERDLANGALSENEDLLTLYADGETCPVQRNVPFHRNWSVSALTLGSEFESAYLSAARNAILSRIDQELSSATNEEDLLEHILHAAVILTQADGGHLRMMADDRLHLIKRCQLGDFASLMDESLPLTGTNKSDVSIECYRSRFIQFSNAPFVKADATPAQLDLIWRTRARVGQPIIAATGEFLGVLTVNSQSLSFNAEGRQTDLQRILGELAGRAASVLKASLHTKHLRKALGAFSSGTLNTDSLIEHGAKLLSPDAVLQLLVPASEGKRLVCKSIFATPSNFVPQDIFVSIDPLDRPSQWGVSGFAFQHPNVPPGTYLFEDVTKLTDANNGPMPKDCLGKPHKEVRDQLEGGQSYDQNYAVLVRKSCSGEIDKIGEPLGVLIAEARPGVLNRRTHLPLLTAIAEACANVLEHEKNALEQESRRGQFEACLGTLVPKHIAADLLHLESGSGQSDHIPAPTLRRTVILHADVRGYTKMSEIVGEANIIDFQHDYFAMVAEAIQAHGGILDKFMGDGVMALFDEATRKWLAEPHENQHENGSRLAVQTVPDGVLQSDIRCAVEAAFQISREFEKLADKYIHLWRKLNPAILHDQKFNIGIAIHCGTPICGLFTTSPDAFDGKIRSMPTSGHTTYTVIGRDVNLAARVCGVVDQNKVWVTAPCWELLNGCKDYHHVWSGPPRRLKPAPKSDDEEKNLLKGISHEIDIFELKDPSRSSASLSEAKQEPKG